MIMMRHLSSSYLFNLNFSNELEKLGSSVYSATKIVVLAGIILVWGAVIVGAVAWVDVGGDTNVPPNWFLK